MAEAMVCGNCSSPVEPGYAFCAECGAALTAAAPVVPQPADGPDAQWQSVRAAASRAAASAAAAGAAAREAAARATAERMAAMPEVAAEPPFDAGAMPLGVTPRAAAFAAALGAAQADTSDASGEPPVRTAYLEPSARHDTLRAIGSARPADVAAWTPAPEPAEERLPEPEPVARLSGVPVSSVLPPAMPLPPLPEPNADSPIPAYITLPPMPSAPAVELPPPPMPAAPVAAATATPAAEPATWQLWLRNKAAAIAAQPRTETVAAFLTAGGGAVAVLSFFMPWAGGVGIGETSATPDNATFWELPAAGPVFLVTVVALALIAASDAFEKLLPEFAWTIRRATEVVLPILLGGLYFGIAIMYITMPWGYGSGIAVLLLGAILLTASAVVGLFYPAPGTTQD